MIELSIIIVNYKNQHLITQCVKSIVDNEKELSYEIIVVDNNSEDDSESILKDIYPDLIWIQMGYNSGFGRANNAGFKKASGKYILILNSDIIIKEKNTLFKCVEEHRRLAKDKLILGVRLVDEKAAYQETLRLRFPGVRREIRANALYILFIERLFGRKFKGKEYQKAAHYKSGEVAYINGAFLLLNRKELLSEKLYFDRDFFLYGEDIEWAWRARKSGFTFYHWHVPEIIHLGSASSKVIKHKFQQVMASDWLYLRKSRGWIYIASTITLILTNQLIDSLLNKFAKLRKKRYSNWEIEQIEKRTWIYENIKKYSLPILFRNKFSSENTFVIDCYKVTD